MADPVVGEALADEKHEDGALQESQPKEGDAIGDHQGAEVGDSKPVDAVIHAADSGGETHKEDTAPPSILQPQHLTSHPADSLHRPDSPTTSLITSLREQLSLLSEQAHQLNTKLVHSLSKQSDLEDAHFDLQRQHEELRAQKGELEKFKSGWEENMNTGLFVERSQIKDEMQRLAAGLVEEERRRGSAEERRQKVEEEVDELAASLFDQANTMVAQERMGRLEAEERLKTTEENLAAAEAAVRDMQLHLQSLPTAGGPAQTTPQVATVNRRYLSSHLPYSEFVAFISHLRLLRPIKDSAKTTLPPPVVTNLLTQPFLARTSLEDHDPTLRLDVAPELSWLSRRGVSTAIIAGDLIIEPVSASSIIAASTSPLADIGCSLCGKPVFPNIIPPSPAASHFGPPPLHPQRNSGSSSRFSLKPFFNTTTTSPSSNPAAHSPASSPMASPNPNTIASTSNLPSVYIFRIAKSTATGATEKEKENKSYPLCKTGWCLERLRATCELWRFVRTGIVQVVWLGDDGHIQPAPTTEQAVLDAPSQKENSPAAAVNDSGAERPDLPARKRSGWALGFKLAERSNSGGGSSWAKGWGKSTASATNSPPVSPKVEKRDSVGAGSVGAEKESDAVVVSDEKEILGAPLELKSPLPGKDDEQSPGAEADAAMEKEQVSGLLPPDVQLSRTTSIISVDSTNKSEKFTTPTAEDADPLDQPAIASEGTEQKEDSQTVPETPGSAGEGGNTANPGTPTGPKSTEVNLNSPKPTPPPIPRRAAARNRASMIAAGESGSGASSPTGSAPPTPTVVEASPIERKVEDTPEQADEKMDADALEMLRSLREEPEPELDLPPVTTEEQVEEREGQPEPEPKPEQAVDIKPAEPTISSPPVATTQSPAPAPPKQHIVPPPLPARHPKTPNMESAPRKEEKTFLPDTTKAQEGEEEDWESKTWKQVIKLKEAMWRTRVGVVEEE